MKLTKVVLSLGLAGALLTGGIQSTEAAKPVKVKNEVRYTNPQTKFHRVGGIVTGWADNNSFEVKTSYGYIVVRIMHPRQKSMVKEGRKLVFFYHTNKYGQNILVRAFK